MVAHGGSTGLGETVRGPLHTVQSAHLTRSSTGETLTLRTPLCSLEVKLKEVCHFAPTLEEDGSLEFELWTAEDTASHSEARYRPEGREAARNLLKVWKRFSCPVARA